MMSHASHDYDCSLKQGIYLDLLPNLETAECLKDLKQFIACQGHPNHEKLDHSQCFQLEDNPSTHLTIAGISLVPMSHQTSGTYNDKAFSV